MDYAYRYVKNIIFTHAHTPTHTHPHTLSFLAITGHIWERMPVEELCFPVCELQNKFYGQRYYKSEQRLYSSDTDRPRTPVPFLFQNIPDLANHLRTPPP